MASKKPKRDARRPQQSLRPPQARTSVADRLESIRAALRSTEHAVEDFDKAGADWFRRETAFANFVTHARRITFLIQRLKDERGFVEWYSPFQAELVADPVSKFFCDLRTEVAHERSVKIDLCFSFTTGPIMTSARIEMDPADGKVVVYDAEDTSENPMPVPTEAYWSASADALPPEVQGKPINDLMRQHLERLRRIVAAAHVRFSPHP